MKFGRHAKSRFQHAAAAKKGSNEVLVSGNTMSFRLTPSPIHKPLPVAGGFEHVRRSEYGICAGGSHL